MPSSSGGTLKATISKVYIKLIFVSLSQHEKAAEEKAKDEHFL